MNAYFDKLNLVTILRIAGLFLFALYVIQAAMNMGRGAEFDDKLLILVVGIANGLFQPLILLALAEIVKSKKTGA